MMIELRRGVWRILRRLIIDSYLAWSGPFEERAFWVCVAKLTSVYEMRCLDDVAVTLVRISV